MLVPRPTLVIADTHGNSRALEGNLVGAQAVDKHLNWTRKGADLVCLGDNLCDRKDRDLQTVYRLALLRAQVANAGGRLVTLTGNHDDWAYAFLFRADTQEDVNGLEGAACLSSVRTGNFGQIRGVQHLGRWALGVAPGTYTDVDLVDERKHTPHREVRERLADSPEGRALKNYFANLRLTWTSGTTLFTHTPPTEAMLGQIIHAQDSCNGDYHALVAKSMEVDLTPAEKNRLDELRHTFVYALNGWDTLPTADDEIWERVAEVGITDICFGHRYSDPNFSVKERGAVTLHALDFRYGRDEGLEDQICSAAWLYPDDRIETGFVHSL